MAHRISCPHCSKTFSKREHLNRHRLSHTGERPFRCSVCSKPFSRRDVLLRHQRGHKEMSSPHCNNFDNVPSNDDQFLVDQLTNGMTDNTVGPGLLYPNIDGGLISTLSHSGQLAGSPLKYPHSSGERLVHDLNTRFERRNLDYASTEQRFLQHSHTPTHRTDDTDTHSQHAQSVTPQDPKETGYRSNSDQVASPGSGSGLLDILLNYPYGQTSVTGDAHQHVVASWHRAKSPVLSFNDGFREAELTPHESHISSKAAKVQRLWPTPQPSSAGTQIWYNIALGTSDNIFSTLDLVAHGNATRNGNDISFPTSIEMQLLALKRSLLGNTCGCPEINNELHGTCDQHYFCKNSGGIFEQGLYLYIDKYQPSYPILHEATFDPQSVQTLLLFLICMIGISFVKAEEAVRFIHQVYPALLDQIYVRMISTTPESTHPATMLTQLVLAHHMLFLVIATEGTLCPTRSQMLYRYTITAAEKLGLFSLNIEQTSDTLFSTVIEDQMSWKLWSRVESVKNLIIGLTLLDSSLSRILSTSPMINTDNLQLALPCDSVLYRARTAAEWSQLARQGFSLTGPTMRLSPYNFTLPSLPSRVHISCLYGPMCVILVRMTANYHRLIVNSDLVPEDQHQHVPWRIYSLDKRARMITPLVVHFIQQYEVNLQGSNPNCVVMWHNLCLWLTADTRLLERAAGREGSEVMQLARQSLYVWAKTPAARRACLHAAQIFYSLSNWRPSYGIGYQPVNCLFQSALVLSLYILVSQEPENTQQYRNEVFDLARANIDWKSVGDEGLAEAPTDPSATGCPAVNFIRYGGPIVVCGKTYVGGARHARRLILDFASLLDEVGKHWMATYPRLLYMIHDTMVDGYVGTPS